ncbi:hypothetical protein BD414DRAFT_468631 [Trametes punicea]|nr:hypothetical protein BD414DRAFT_468631 [Trametes punicea]
MSPTAQGSGRWLWTEVADINCIDSFISAALRDTISSRFHLCRDASTCYAYLADVPSGEDPYLPHPSFRRNEWWSRMWSLQELINLASIIFLSSLWKLTCLRRMVAEVIESITGMR